MPVPVPVEEFRRCWLSPLSFPAYVTWLSPTVTKNDEQAVGWDSKEQATLLPFLFHYTLPSVIPFAVSSMVNSSFSSVETQEPSIWVGSTFCASGRSACGVWTGHCILQMMRRCWWFLHHTGVLCLLSLEPLPAQRGSLVDKAGGWWDGWSVNGKCF